MLDLSKLKRENYKMVWLDGEILELKQPKQQTLIKLIKTVKFYEDKMDEINQLEDDDIEKVLDEFDSMMTTVYDLLYDILNNNTNKKVIKREEIEDSPIDWNIAIKIMTDYLTYAYNDLGE